MSWLLVIVSIAGSPMVHTVRFPNKVSCDQIRLWIETKAKDQIATVCLQDLDESQAPQAPETPTEPNPNQ